MNKVTLKGQEVPIIYHNKSTKHSYVRVKAPGIIHVTLGRYANKAWMNDLIEKNADALLKQVKKHTEDKPYTLFGETVKQVLIDEKTAFYKEEEKTLYLPKDRTQEALKKFEKTLLLKTVKQILDVFPHKDFLNVEGLTINTRYTSTVNGSCHAKKRRINLNLYLVRKPKIFLHYVLMHELAHLKVQNHSKDFYQVLEVLCPNYKDIKKAMRSY
jgi:predicted metal-dependent hydrolase